MTLLPTILYQVYTHWDKQLFSLRRHLGVRVPARPGQEDWGGKPNVILSCSAKPQMAWEAHEQANVALALEAGEEMDTWKEITLTV